MLLALALIAAAPAAGAAATPQGRIVGAFTMQGRIITAVRVLGEHRGQVVQRHWTFTGVGCGRRSCRQLLLRRERSAGQFDRLTLRPTGRGSYAGSGRFYAPLTCIGGIFPRGEIVPYRVTVRITRASKVQGIWFADRLAATYTNLHRIDLTRCPLGPSHDAASYTGTASPAVTAPTPGFTQSVDGATDLASFTDTSRPGGGGAPIVSWHWDFGDHASGGANTSTAENAQHRFSAPGSYGVTLVVRDANGLTARATATVVAPGPPSASFAAAPTGAPFTSAFQDQSKPGIGRAAITGWSWNFGDPASGKADTSAAQNPQHTFTAAGTYTVTLTVTDANGRTATFGAPVTVAAP